MPATDVIIIGSGHNGLIAANYLADAGLSVRVLERRHVIGGATVTEEQIPGFYASSCSYVSGLLHPKILHDMQLDQHGLHLYQCDVGSTNILHDGRTLTLYNDLSHTLRNLEEAKRGESERFVEFGLQMQKFARIVNQWLITTEPPTIAQVVQGFYDADAGDLFAEFFGFSVEELVSRYFTSDILKGLLTFLGVVSVWGGPLTPGWAYVYGHHAIGEYDGHMGQFAFPRGGMGSIANALATRAKAKGVVVTTGATVEKVTTRRGRVTGVLLVDGEHLDASTVLSNADPVVTYGRLVDPTDLPEDLVSRIDGYDVRGSMARVFLALDTLPRFIGRPAGEGPEHRGLTLVGAEVERFTAAGRAQELCRIPDDFPIEFIIQSVHDESLAPAGKHILSTGIQQLPFELDGTTWDDQKPAFTAKVLDTMESYAPGIKDSVIDTKTITPLDLEREYGLTGGNIFHGAMTLGQLFDNRPVPGANGYRSPVEGLYLCGSGVHPGGGVMGTPGHNAAHAVLQDRFGQPSLAAPRTGGSSTPLIERVMRNDKVRRIALRAARNPRLAPMVDRFSARK